MQTLSQVVRGLLIALASVSLLIGGLVLSFAEGNSAAYIPTETPAATLTWQPVTLQPETPTPLPPTRTPTFPPTPTNCPPPERWVPYFVQAGDTIENLAVFYQLSKDELTAANCLVTVGLLPGAVVYVPPVSTPTPIPCGPKPGWITYTVRKGDTLYHISQTYGIEVWELQQANCLTGSFIRTGQRLYIPPWPSRTPSPTTSGTPTKTETPTPTSATLTKTITPSKTSTPTSSSTPTPDTPTPTLSDTPGFTPTATNP